MAYHHRVSEGMSTIRAIISVIRLYWDCVEKDVYKREALRRRLRKYQVTDNHTDTPKTIIKYYSEFYLHFKNFLPHPYSRLGDLYLDIIIHTPSTVCNRS
jgi:hypothetical protein